VAGAAVMMVELPQTPAPMAVPPSTAPPGPEEQVRGDETPKEETKPPEPEETPKETKPQMAEVALPQPEPPKPEEPKPQPPGQEQDQAPSSVMAVPSAAPPTAGVETPQPPSPAVLRWQSKLSAQIAKAKRYPPKADARREQGTAKVSFRIDENGRVVESSIVESSGWPHLDEEALLTLGRAQFPKPPPGTKPEERLFIFPLVFALPK
jgi:protein TonB